MNIYYFLHAVQREGLAGRMFGEFTLLSVWQKIVWRMNRSTKGSFLTLRIIADDLLNLPNFLYSYPLNFPTIQYGIV